MLVKQMVAANNMFNSDYSKALVGFDAVFAVTSAVTLEAVFDAFANNPETAEWFLLRLAPGLIMVWVTGFAVYYGRKKEKLTRSSA